MSELDDAIARLKAAVARLEAAAEVGKCPAEEQRATEAAAAIAGRIDAALAKLAQLLDREA